MSWQSQSSLPTVLLQVPMGHWQQESCCSPRGSGDTPWGTKTHWLEGDVFSCAVQAPCLVSCLDPCSGESSLGCDHALMSGGLEVFLQPPSSAPSQRQRCSGVASALPRGCSACLHHTLPMPAMGGCVAGGCAVGVSAAGVPCKPGSFPVPM